jgi:SAM-dependent methyltransferase
MRSGCLYPAGAFDAVVSESVLEHLPDPTRAFNEFRRVLRRSGLVVFLTPSRHDYVSIAARAIPNALHSAIIKAIEGRREGDTFPTYYRANSARRLKRIAGRTGFAVERLSYLNHYPYLLTFSPLLCRLAIAYDAVVSRFKCLEFLRSSLLGLFQKRS